MAITDDLRKTLSDPTPFYFAAGTADLALQQARKVPGLVEQLRAEAPARIEAVRNADPKAVQEKAASRAKEAGAKAKEAQASLQARVNDFIVSLDGDLKKLGESAQDFALRQVGVAAEYAVKARETYEKVAEHGEQAVKTWRGDAAEEIEDLAIAVEGKPEPVAVKADEKKAERPKAAEAKPVAVKKAPTASAGAGGKKAPAPRKATPVKKTTPPAK
ncbi:hypothetical protein AB0D38_01635 [Streptomyces sp. NPDC048279]|uniref:hypothetical protein n=1 Tax=Streptomyces sp. NPDC048279 TaxID=3154714 RepID=UPI00342AB0D0